MPTHYLNRCWVVLNWTLGNKFQGDLNQHTNIFIHANEFENTICKIFSYMEMRLKISSAKWGPCCLGLSLLKNVYGRTKQHQATTWANVDMLPGPALYYYGFAEVPLRKHNQCSAKALEKWGQVTHNTEKYGDIGGHLCYIAICESHICGDIGPYSPNNWGHSWFKCAKCPQNAASS